MTLFNTSVRIETRLFGMGQNLRARILVKAQVKMLSLNAAEFEFLKTQPALLLYADEIR